MQNPKLETLQRQSTVERLFGKDAAVPPRPAAAEDTTEKLDEDSPLQRKSYCILRGRVEMRPVLKLMNRHGEIRLFPWSYFAGANMNHPGELLLLFEGADSSSAITVSGRFLDGELLEGIAANRVLWIRELDELAAAGVAAADAAEPVVSGIHVKEGSVSRQWSRGTGHSR